MNQNPKKRVVIKIGSSSLTSYQGEISRRKIEKLVDEIIQLKDAGHEVLLVSSGAVAAGYRKLGFLERPSRLPEKQAAASIGQSLLMEVYSNLFLSHGYVVSQILITKEDFSDADMLIILSDIDGLYNGDPRDKHKAVRLERVQEITPKIEAAAGDSGSTVGTGGMKSKLEAFKLAMACGISSFLGKAGTPNILRDAVAQKAQGTYFEAGQNTVIY